MMQGIIERTAQPQNGMPFDQTQELERMAQTLGPEREDAFKRVVMAGKRILYGKETQKMVNEFLETEAPVAEQLGAGIANLVIMIDNQAQGNIPKEVIVPAATVLLFDAADFLKQSGQTITVQDIGAAYEIMFYNLFSGYGVPPEQLDMIMDEVAANEGLPPDSMQGNMAPADQDPRMMGGV